MSLSTSVPARPASPSSSNHISSASLDDNEFDLACTLASIPVDDRRCLVVRDRALALFRQRKASYSNSASDTLRSALLPDGSRIWALDSICYHMGGPLIESDIETIGSSPVVVCPWHKFRIDLETGEGMYKALDGSWKSKGLRQRTHHVRIKDDNVYVRVSSKQRDGGDKIESDTYAEKAPNAAEIEAAEAKRRASGPTRLLTPSGMMRSY